MACYTDHHVLLQPKDLNGKVWRYMDLPKFISLLNTKSLYFSKPSSFNDPYEGKSTKSHIDEQKANYKNKIHYALSTYNFNESTYINCWHYNNYESEAMWKIFSDSKNSVAIQSRYDFLTNCIPDTINGSKIYTGLIKYIDYEKEDQIIKEPLDLYCYKRKAFEHEHEIRIIFDTHDKTEIINTQSIVPIIKSPKKSFKIEIDLFQLIENVYVSPNSDNWFIEIVKSIIKQYEFNFNVIRSEIDKTPDYYKSII